MSLLGRRDTMKGLACGAFAGLGAGEVFAASSRNAEVWPAVDVLVCGGGPAGVAAAWMAARAGCKTLLVERHGRIGGMAVQAMVGPLMGDVRSDLVDRILRHIGGRRVDYEFLDPDRHPQSERHRSGTGRLGSAPAGQRPEGEAV